MASESSGEMSDFAQEEQIEETPVYDQTDEINPVDEDAVFQNAFDEEIISGSDAEQDIFTEDADFALDKTDGPETDPDIRYIKGRPLTEEELARQRSLEKVGGSMLAPRRRTAIYTAMPGHMP